MTNGDSPVIVDHPLDVNCSSGRLKLSVAFLSLITGKSKELETNLPPVNVLVFVVAKLKELGAVLKPENVLVLVVAKVKEENAVVTPANVLVLVIARVNAPS